MEWLVAADARCGPTTRTCGHLEQAVGPVAERPRGCDGCARAGTRWVQLRECLTCGFVGCCDSSPMRHARAHFTAHGHPLVRAHEPGGQWGWCFHDEVLIVRTEPRRPSRRNPDSGNRSW